MKDWYQADPKVFGQGGPPHGSRHPHAILNEDLVREIRSAHFDHGWSFGQIAERWKISTSCVSHAVVGRSWRHVVMEARWAELHSARQERLRQRKEIAHATAKITA